MSGSRVLAVTHVHVTGHVTWVCRYPGTDLGMVSLMCAVSQPTLQTHSNVCLVLLSPLSSHYLCGDYRAGAVSPLWRFRSASLSLGGFAFRVSSLVDLCFPCGLVFRPLWTWLVIYISDEYTSSCFPTGSLSVWFSHYLPGQESDGRGR